MHGHKVTDIVNHSRNTALEQSVKILVEGGWGGGLGVALIDFTWPQTSSLVLPWYTQDNSFVRVKGS